MRLVEDGALHLPGAVRAFLSAIEAALDDLPTNRPGVRLGRNTALSSLLRVDGAIGGHTAALLGPSSRPVRAILFDKQPGLNWSLGWHQDRTICVACHCDAPGFGPWTVKDGRHHVAPPIELLARMVTLRVHLDDVGPDNAPLLIVAGSHRLGRIAESEVDRLVSAGPVHACLAEAGDVWLYATPILHASHAARAPCRRRVLQVDYAADDLPAPLKWAGL